MERVHCSYDDGEVDIQLGVGVLASELDGCRSDGRSTRVKKRREEKRQKRELSIYRDSCICVSFYHS